MSWLVEEDGRDLFNVDVSLHRGHNELRVHAQPGFADRAAACAAKVTTDLLGEHGLALDDVDLVVASPQSPEFHEALQGFLGIAGDRLVAVDGAERVHTAGLLVGVDAAMDDGRWAAAGTVLLVSAGAGITAGAALVQPMSAPSPAAVAIRAAETDAVVFDMDGVVTDTASVHAAAWKRLFDGYLAERARREGTDFVPFEDEDYIRDVDGKPRYDGVRSFLASRGIVLPEGDASDPVDAETVAGLGNRKDEYFLASLRRDGVRAYDTTVDFVRRLESAGLRTAVISASRNMTQVLSGAGLADLFAVRVDGIVADALHIPGKPDPAVFLEAARRLDVAPARTAVVEDALAGVAAGRAGGFRLVIGVDRSGHADALRRAGADVVVTDLAEVQVT